MSQEIAPLINLGQEERKMFFQRKEKYSDFIARLDDLLSLMGLKRQYTQKPHKREVVEIVHLIYRGKENDWWWSLFGLLNNPAVAKIAEEPKVVPDEEPSNKFTVYVYDASMARRHIRHKLGQLKKTSRN